MSVKSRLRKTTMACLRLAGIFHFFRFVNRKKIVILVAHSVMNESESTQWTPLRKSIPTRVLEEQISLLSKYYNWVTIDEAVAMIAGDQQPVKNSIAITFDDGYTNNMTHALPILKRHGVKPVFYIPTAFLNSKEPFWFNRMDYILQCETEPYVIEAGGRSFEFDPTDRRKLSRSFKELRSFMKSKDWSDHELHRFIDDTCDRLERECEDSLQANLADDPWCSTMSEDSLRDLSTKNLATIGSHTVNHTRLDKVSAEECDAELSRSKTILENIIGTPCNHFCYPNGAIDPTARALVEKNGYGSAVTSFEGLNDSGDDVFSLRRIHLPTKFDGPALLSELCGLSYLLNKLRPTRRRQSA